ncbi:HNH endonuclease signature motif containing protein [Ornithinicoccus halotolerans]|uniref:HNH endonuclease signature motif containing protein n=1 Tax=Ornithinicoccus halotolerans TaxID=1748220 RepID=UPI001296AB70|nr:HNH endonuclease signature motif containing protein [Ornithinicoccus halotolerans]
MSVSVLEEALSSMLTTAGVPESAVAGRGQGPRPVRPDTRWLRRRLLVVRDAGSTRDEAPAAEEGQTADQRLRDALADVGLDPSGVECLARAAEAMGALQGGTETAPLRGSEGAPADGADGAVHTEAARAVLDGIGALVGASARADAAVLTATRKLTARNGQVLLARKGVTEPGELTSGQREKWRARAKSVTRHEIEALTGWGAGEVLDLVGVANAPQAVSGVVVGAMARGVAPWRLVRRFWRQSAQLAHEDAAHVANTLFGADLATVAVERLTPEGAVSEGPWRHREFYLALDREVSKVGGRDPAACRERREQALAGRDVRATVDADGTGCVVINGSAVQVAALMDRLERAARLARKHGDPRTLGQLRADVALSLLLHARLPLPDPPADGDPGSVAHSAALAQVLQALPSAVLNVIVPYSALHARDPGLVGPGRAGGTGSAFWSDARASGKAPRQPVGRPPGQPSTGPPAESLMVGQVQGAYPMFVTPDLVRDMALLPGTVMHRLLVDPADGRCVERSVAAYRPDAAMRAQILAADVTCRAPGCIRAGEVSQYDHAREFAEGGPTAESNLELLHTAHHDLKTQRFWDAALDGNRDVTWTTLLGRIYRTRCHDYRQYLTLVTESIAEVRSAADDETDLVQAVNQAVYAALSYRAPTEVLQAEDDDLDADLRFHGWDLISVTHTADDGQTRYRPHPDVVAAERRRDDESRGLEPRHDTGRDAGYDDEPPPF